MCIHLWLSKIGSPMYIASIAHRWFDYEWLCSNFDSSCYMNWTGWLDTRAVVYHTYTPCGCILFILYLARINELFSNGVHATALSSIISYFFHCSLQCTNLSGAFSRNFIFLYGSSICTVVNSWNFSSASSQFLAPVMLTK